jgi:plastocyanin
MARWRTGARARRLGVVLAAVVLGGLSSVGVSSAAGDGAAPSGEIGARVKIRGRFELQPNQYVQLTFRFDPGPVNVSRGQDIKFTDVAQVKEPHTVTIVRQGQLPQTAREAFQCKPCNRALQRHGRPPKRLVEDDNDREKGLDAPGDSRWIAPGGSARPTVTAPRNTTLYYLCAIHPWMQGRINVQ